MTRYTIPRRRARLYALAGASRVINSPRPPLARYAWVLFLSGLAVAISFDADARAAPQLVLPGAGTQACAWTGRHFLVWPGRSQVFALRPDEKAWRTFAAAPRAGRVLQQSLLAMADGSALAVYWVVDGGPRLCVDRCRPDSGRWERVASLTRKELRHQLTDVVDVCQGEEKAYFALGITGMAAVADGIVVFMGSPDNGVRVAGDGKVKFLSDQGVPEGGAGWRDTVVCSFGGKILYYHYAHVGYNTWGVWDDKTDTWSRSQTCDPRYAFAHCQAGDSVYVFGGAESSAYGWVKRDALVYSFRDNRWRKVPVDNGPPGRRNLAMCWTGKEILVWGGQTLGGTVAAREKGAATVPLSAVMAFDPSRNAWRALPGRDSPSERADASVAWTGTEMIVWGGWSRNGECSDGYAYDPKAGRWRKLPDLPREAPRAESDAGAR
jgi:N-acetylneuraminic acid mutarotase